MTMIEAVSKLCGLPRCVPPDPEREGYHWIRRFRGGPAIPLHWNPVWWHNADRGWGVWGQPDRESEWEYLGPCPSPENSPAPLTVEDVYANCYTTMIGFAHELTPRNIEFICDQISRKVILALSSAQGKTP